ncbi:MAG: MFS transporter [Acidimicrobiaceae bacterium]|nr:MFS transporter [Acidimicrobiaceae bacterium]
MTIAIGALDNTIVSTAIPSVVRDLGGFNQFPWVFSIYLLTQAVTTPLYGRLADSYGRKPVLFFGITVFLFGSALSGVSWDMTTLIVFRGVQGIGAGAVLPIAMTIVGDLYTVEERGRVQGYLSSVWGIAAVLGPSLGGVFSQYLSWRWIFYLNLPVGALAVTLISRRLKEQVQRRKHEIDYSGAVALMAGVAMIVLALLEGGVRWAWTSTPELVLIPVGVATLGIFAYVERRASEPFVPPWIFGRRGLLLGTLAGFGIGGLLTGLDAYVPTFSQGVVGVGPVLAGFALASQSVTWVAASPVAGRLYPRTGFRFTAVTGGALCLLGALLFTRLGFGSGLGSVAVAGAVVGAGFGFMASSTIVAVQSTVGPERRGVVTGTNMFARTIGGAVGTAICGSLANAALGAWLRTPPPHLRPYLPHSTNAAALVLGGSSAVHNQAASTFIRHGISLATHHVFLFLFGASVVLFALVACFPRHFEHIPADATEDETAAR